MTEFMQGMLVVMAYRALTICLGFGMAYLGYRLFRLGVYEKAGDLKAAWGQKNLTLKQAAPGTFFALFGVFVVVVSLFRPVDITHDRSSAGRGLTDPAVASETQSASSANSTSPVNSSKDEDKPEIVGTSTPSGAEATNTPKQEESTVIKDGKSSAADTSRVVALTSKMDTIMKRVTEGKPITTEERVLLKQWYENDRVHYFAVVPKKRSGEVTG